jgi:hypothetical protein
MSTGNSAGEISGIDTYATDGRGRGGIERLFELPATIQVPGGHVEIEGTARSGQYVQAAKAIGELRFASRVDQNRAALAQAICWMSAGQPERAESALAGRRTMANAWYLACALVRLGRLEEAADQVLWVGERIPLLGGERRAAQVLLRMLGKQLPSWLAESDLAAQPADRRRTAAPPYLASFFYPARPDVPSGFEGVAEAIQQRRYDEAALRLIAHSADDARLSGELAVATAKCWLLAEEPEAAEAWLPHELSAEGVWALACTRVQQNRSEGALEPLAWLAQRGLLTDERRDAAAVLVAHLHLESLPPGLREELLGHPLRELGRAQEAGYRRFAEEVVREIERQRDRDTDAVERIVHRVVTQCRSVPEDEARRVLVPTYEAAVRVSYMPSLAERGLHLLLSRPDLLGSAETPYSQALLFATACGRLGELHEQLHELAQTQPDRGSQFANWLACAKLSLVEGDPIEAGRHADRAVRLADSPEAAARAQRLARAACWLAPSDPVQVSQWRLRALHHQLPLGVAERLEDRDLAWLEQRVGTSAGARQSLDAAHRHLLEAVKIDDDPTGDMPRLQRSLGLWAFHIGLALLDSGDALTGDAVPFTGAACRLLGPAPPAHVVSAHARALGLACAPLGEPAGVMSALDPILGAMPLAPEAVGSFVQSVVREWEDGRRTSRPIPGQEPPDLDRLLRPVSAPPRRPALTSVAAAIGELEAIPHEARLVIEHCLAARAALLPDVAPFRGRRWFHSDDAHRLYQRGRTEHDARAAQRSFEEAWTLEPNNRVTTQGLILGLRRRVREKPARTHLLQHVAAFLDQMVEREVEAALAHATLAELAGPGRERRGHLGHAAAAIQRRVLRRPWTRVRNVEIALQLELGNLLAAGEAAWAESLLHLPGSGASHRYALLAATLWERAWAPDRSLDQRVRAARDHARSPRLTTRGAVRYAVSISRLVVLTDVSLDDDALEDLWRMCRGDEEDLCRFLEKQGTRSVDPARHYLEFLATKQETVDGGAAARIRHCFLSPESAPVPPRMRWLRLAMAELLTRDPLLEVAMPLDRLGEVHMREFLATLRECARPEAAAYAAFTAAVEDALAALFELREAAPVSAPGVFGSRLARASELLTRVSRTASRQFGTPAVAEVAQIMGLYLGLALETPTIDAYTREKEKRLIPSRVGVNLGGWWARLSEVTGSLDFFHHHQAYRCAHGVPAESWWRDHRVHGKPVREALENLLQLLEMHARQLDAIEDQYLRYRDRRDPGPSGFGLRAEFDDCCRVLRTALAPAATLEQVTAIQGALARLGTSLRHIDLSRLVDLPDVLYDSALPAGCYLLPRAPELLGHWYQNVRGGRCLQAICEVRDDSGRSVLCLLCLDAEPVPVPDAPPLRGLAPFAETVEALGGQFHLWVARPGEPCGCRREHIDGVACAADDHVVRIEQELRQLAATRWHVQQPAIRPWLAVLDAALRSTGSANLAFIILPRLHE